jgi:hypothetical protein
MNFISDLLIDLGGFMRSYNSDISLAFVASLLVIVGGDINRYIKVLVRSSHFLVRISVFIAVCTFGYGALTPFLTQIITSQLATLSSLYLPLVIISCFIALGIYAEQKLQI